MIEILMKPYTVCWLHTCDSDHYVGPIEQSKVVGKRLHLTLSPMVKVERLGIPFEWQPVGKRFTSYSFDFEASKILEANGKSVRLRTVNKDEVILSIAETDQNEVNNLVT